MGLDVNIGRQRVKYLVLITDLWRRYLALAQCGYGHQRPRFMMRADQIRHLLLLAHQKRLTVVGRFFIRGIVGRADGHSAYVCCRLQNLTVAR